MPTTTTSPSTADAVVDLLRRAAAGDQSAWTELVRRYVGVVWSVAREHGLDSADAADVSQVVWLNLAQRLHTLRAPERLAGWLATSARHECLRVLAARRRETPLSWLDFPSAPAAGLADPERAVVLADTEGVLWQAFAALPERCRKLLRLIAHAPELSHAQAARALGVRLGSVGKTRGRCLADLRRRLSGFGVVDGAI